MTALANQTRNEPMRVGVTGASGAIGRAVMRELAEGFDLTPMSRSINGTDLRDAAGLTQHFAGMQGVIHLAWQYAEHAKGGGYLDNLAMNRNVLEAARSAGVKRVVLASSVHADYFYDWAGPELVHPDRPPRGNGPYGCAKVMVEEMGREAAGDALEVVCVRYGGVTAEGPPHPTDAWERRVWLSHRDLGTMLTAALTVAMPDPFAVLYAVSDNFGRVHDTTNPFGWVPVDRAEPLPA